MTLQQLIGAVLLLGSIWIGETGQERREGDGFKCLNLCQDSKDRFINSLQD